MVQYQGLSDDDMTNTTNMTNHCSLGLFANITRFHNSGEISNATVTLK